VNIHPVFLPVIITDIHSARYVLWTDEDNRKLTRDYYPEYLYAYNSLPREIYRADMVSVYLTSSLRFPAI
jgi:hypothetical protein